MPVWSTDAALLDVTGLFIKVQPSGLVDGRNDGMGKQVGGTRRRYGVEKEGGQTASLFFCFQRDEEEEEGMTKERKEQHWFRYNPCTEEGKKRERL